MSKRATMDLPQMGDRPGRIGVDSTVAGMAFHDRCGLDSTPKSYIISVACTRPANLAELSRLGNALARLGERENGTARLKEAVEAYWAALEEWTRERVPLDWAMTQHNLGTALRALGERESGTARLEDAVAAYRAALQERTRERVPRYWAMTQHFLGRTLVMLGELESGTTLLEEAVAAYRAALEVRTRERMPLDWAMTQRKLGSALSWIGARERGAARLEDAVSAWEACLTVVESAWPEKWIEEVRSDVDAARTEIVRRSLELSAVHKSRGLGPPAPTG